MQPGNHTGFVQDISKPEVLVFLQFFGKLNQFLNFGSESSSTNTEETRLITMRSQYKNDTKWSQNIFKV